MLILSITTTLCSFAQTLTPKQDQFIRKTIATQYGDMYNKEVLEKGQDVFAIVGKDTIYNPHGYHYVFKLASDTAQRLDHCVWHGGNFRRFLFAYDDNLYALGGYGFFNTNNNLEYFNAKIQEWSFKPTFGQVPPYILGLCFKKGDTVYSLNNLKSGNATSPDVYDTCVYQLHLKTMNWEAFTMQDRFPSFNGFTYYLKDYVFQLGFTNQSLLVKAAEMKYLLINNEDYGFLRAYNFKRIRYNSIDLRSLGTSHDTLFDTIDFDAIWQKNKAKAKLFNLKPIAKASNTQSLTWLYVVMGATMLCLLVLLVYIKRQAVNTQMTLTEEDVLIEHEPKTSSLNTELPIDLYALLCQSDKTILVTEELDELLGIAHLEPDSKKLKRHRLLSELEKNHPGFISRTKDPIDKRRFTYQLTKPTH